jgi:Protein of unknown function (DUF1499)
MRARSVRLLLACLLGGVIFAVVLSTADTATGRPVSVGLWLPFGLLWALGMWAFFRRSTAAQDRQDESRTASFVLPLPPAAALDRAADALRRVGARRVRATAAEGRATGRRRTSRVSWGEDITVTVQPLSDGSSRVTVRSDGWPFQPLVDWGVNRRNVEAMVDAMRRDT